jgi:hypothetical protein
MGFLFHCLQNGYATGSGEGIKQHRHETELLLPSNADVNV